MGKSPDKQLDHADPGDDTQLRFRYQHGYGADAHHAEGGSRCRGGGERENRTQFEGFHQLLYEMAATELKGTQFILVDKEFCKPEKDPKVEILARHMTVDKSSDPPLIPYSSRQVTQLGLYTAPANCWHFGTEIAGTWR
jgi:hypothetical protein